MIAELLNAISKNQSMIMIIKHMTLLYLECVSIAWCSIMSAQMVAPSLHIHTLNQSRQKDQGAHTPTPSLVTSPFALMNIVSSIILSLLGPSPTTALDNTKCPRCCDSNTAISWASAPLLVISCLVCYQLVYMDSMALFGCLDTPRITKPVQFTFQSGTGKPMAKI